MISTCIEIFVYKLKYTEIERGRQNLNTSRGFSDLSALRVLKPIHRIHVYLQIFHCTTHNLRNDSIVGKPYHCQTNLIYLSQDECTCYSQSIGFSCFCPNEWEYSYIVQQKRYQTKTRTGLRANLPLSTEPADHGRNGAEGWTISPTLNKRKQDPFGRISLLPYWVHTNLIKFKQGPYTSIYTHPIKQSYIATCCSPGSQDEPVGDVTEAESWNMSGVVLGGWCLACFSWRVVRFFQFCFVLHSFCMFHFDPYFALRLKISHFLKLSETKELEYTWNWPSSCTSLLIFSLSMIFVNRSHW